MQTLGLFALVLAALWFLGPREVVPPVASVELEGDLAAISDQFAAEEAALGDVTPGVEKRIIFQGAARKTDWAVVYVHGFSATSEEIRPVPDRVADKLGANLFYMRLTGHGQPGAKLGVARVADWMEDLGEAVALSKMLGDKVLIMGTSTGGTLSALLAAQDESAADAYVFLAPNFGLQAAGSELLTMPLARHWVPMLVGAERSWEPKNAQHGEFWTTTYPTAAVMPLAAVTKAAREASYASVETPVLVFLSDADTVVKPDVTRAVMANWPGAEIVALEMGVGDDPDAHVIAGSIMSPGQTDAVVEKVLDWLEQ